MLFPQRMVAALESGAVTMTVRRWKRPQARVGSRQRVSSRGVLVIESCDAVPYGSITEEDARRSGFADRSALKAFHEGIDDDEVVYRVAFHFEPEPPPPPPAADLTDAEIAALDRALDAVDGRSPTGPWTVAVLRLIAEHPGRRAGDLADMLGRERLPFKADVRKLKARGLTEALEVGYRLSPRGRAYLDRTQRT